MSECYLADAFGCADSGKYLVKAGHERIEKIISSSKLRQDNIYLELEGKLAKADSKEGLIQAVADNYDTNISS